MDQYRVPLPHGRELILSGHCLRRVARGLGDQFAEPIGDGQEPAIIAALRALPPSQRADATAVVLRRFGDKQDVESIAHQCGLTAWQVWQLEESFRRALGEVRESTTAQARLVDAIEASPTARVMSAEMLSNAIAHREPIDLDRAHEASLRAARESRG